MLIRPNETRVRGRIREVRPAPDGQGFELRVSVTANESTAPETDFLRPQPGTELVVFAGERPDVKEGQECSLKARLLGGPFGQRAVLTEVRQG